jgi:putative NADH-flavin reductase
MNLLIFGATGATGQELVNQALAQGNTVTAFVRSLANLKTQHPNLKVVKGEVTDAETVENAIKGQDAVFSTLGSKSLKKNPKLVQGVRNIVREMEKQGVQRLIYQSSLGVGDSKKQVNPLVRYLIIPLVLRNAITDHTEKENIIEKSSLDWVIIRPAGLTNDPYTGNYRYGELINFGAKIARADVADFMLKQVQSIDYLYKKPGISY